MHCGHVFYASRKSEVVQDKMLIVAAVADCRKPLVSIGWTVSHLVCTNGLRECYYLFVQAPFLIVGILQIFELLIGIN